MPTFNRLDRLKRCTDKTRQNVTTFSEVIVVDGGSNDGSREWLGGQADLRVILEPEREGAVRAFNKGFKAATGRYVMWLNDDAYPLPGAVEAAVDLIQRPLPFGGRMKRISASPGSGLSICNPFSVA